MSHLDYIIAAYLVFAGVMVWEYLLPRLQIRRMLRALKRQEQRRAAHAAADTSNRGLER